VAGTLTLLELVRHPARYEIVFVSSGGTVYGIPREVPIKETHPTDPICAYGIGSSLSRNTSTSTTCSMESSIGCSAWRIPTAKDSGRLPGRASSRCASTRSCGENGSRLGETERWRDYLYVGDAMEAFLKVTFYSGVHRVFISAAARERASSRCCPPWRRSPGVAGPKRSVWPRFRRTGQCLGHLTSARAPWLEPRTTCTRD